MAKFKVKVRGEIAQALGAALVEHKDDVLTGAIPEYPVFVNRLMKEMASPAEELHHSCTGLAGEAGEILDVSKKVWVYNKTLDVGHLIEELGDLRFYYQTVLNMFGLKDEHIQAMNTKKLRKRYHEGTYSDAQANARADKVTDPGARNFIGADQRAMETFQKSHTTDTTAKDADRKQDTDKQTISDVLRTLPVVGVINVDNPKDPRHKQPLPGSDHE